MAKKGPSHHFISTNSDRIFESFKKDKKSFSWPKIWHSFKTAIFIYWQHFVCYFFLDEHDILIFFIVKYFWSKLAFKIQTLAWERNKCRKENSFLLRMTWLGHASVLAEVDGKTVLTDPIFSNRASAVQVNGKPVFNNLISTYHVVSLNR